MAFRRSRNRMGQRFKRHRMMVHAAFWTWDLNCVHMNHRSRRRLPGSGLYSTAPRWGRASRGGGKGVTPSLRTRPTHACTQRSAGEAQCAGGGLDVGDVGVPWSTHHTAASMASSTAVSAAGRASRAEALMAYGLPTAAASARCQSRSTWVNACTPSSAAHRHGQWYPASATQTRTVVSRLCHTDMGSRGPLMTHTRSRST
jgi:hypothetical protein